MSHLLFRLCTSTWPLDDDILFGFSVGSKRECDTRECGPLRPLSVVSPRCRVKATHKIDADNELSFASRIVTLHFGWPAIIRVRALYRLWPVAIWLMSLWRLPHGISGWRRLGVELLLVLRSVRMPSAGVDRWRRHRTRRPALIRMPWSSQCPSLVGVLV